MVPKEFPHTIPVPVAAQSVASSKSCKESYEQFDGGVQHTSIDDLQCAVNRKRVDSATGNGRQLNCEKRNVR